MPTSRFAPVFLAALFACSTRSLSDYSTSSVYADITATASGNGSTSVGVTYKDSALSLTYLQLTSDDKVTATTGTTTQTLGETSLAGLVTYGTTFYVEAGTFVIALARKKDSGAPNSTIALPTPFELTPPTGSSFSRAQPLTLSWSADAGSTDATAVTISGSCIQEYGLNAQANASQVTIPAGTLQKAPPPANGQVVPDTCTATATFQRQHSGTLDPAYASGTISGEQQRSESFTTAP